MALTEKQRSNIECLLQTHAQYKHLSKAADIFNLKARQGKTPIIKELLERLEEGSIEGAKFKNWLCQHQIDGNNYFFVYELDKTYFSSEYLGNLIDNIGQNCFPIYDIDKETLETTKLVSLKYDEQNKRAIFAYIAPSTVIHKEKDGNNTIMTTNKETYWAHIIVEAQLNQVIVAINPTTNLIAVSGIEKNRKTRFEPIAYHFLEQLRSVTNKPFFVLGSSWVYDALYKLAEEGTHHNNPQISIELTKYSQRIDEFSESLLTAADLGDSAGLAYLQEELKQIFENLLIDKYGIITTEDQYRVFEQTGDDTDTFVYVSSRTSSLQEGRAARVAKATRAHSDVTVLGVERTFGEQVFRLTISKQTDGFLVRNYTSRFTEEVIVRDVIAKINSYKGQIQPGGHSNAETGEVSIRT